MPAEIATLVASTLLASAPATVVGTAALSATLATAYAVTYTATSLALIAGTQYAVGQLQRTLTDRSGGNFGSPATVNAPEVRGSVRQATPPQRIVFGKTRIGGAFFFYEVVPPFLYIGHIYSRRPISSVLRVTLEEREISFSRTGSIWTPLNEPFLSGANNRVQFAFQDGSSELQAINPILDADFADLTENFRLPSTACGVWKFDYGADFDEHELIYGQIPIPNPLIEVEGAPLYDPRDPSQRRSDPRTWIYSNTAALAQAHWLAEDYGLGAGYERVDWDRVAEAATWDEGLVGLLDGTLQRRHTIDGVVSLDERPSVVMEALLTANRGFLVQRAGRGWIGNSAPQDPVLSISDRMLAGALTFRRDKQKRDLVNEVRTRFVAPDREYQDADGPFLIRADLQEADGELLSATVRLPMTSTHQRAQRLAKQYLLESRLEKSLSLVCDLSALGVEVGEVVRRVSELFPEQEGLYTVEEWALDEERCRVTLTLAEYDPTIATDWHAETDEQPFELAEAA